MCESGLIEDGNDPEIVWLRNSMPEPSSWPNDNPVLFVPNKRRTGNACGQGEFNFGQLDGIAFRKVKLFTPMGGSFWAWQCERDGAIYV